MTSTNWKIPCLTYFLRLFLRCAELLRVDRSFFSGRSENKTGASNFGADLSFSSHSKWLANQSDPCRAEGTEQKEHGGVTTTHRPTMSLSLWERGGGTAVNMHIHFLNINVILSLSLKTNVRREKKSYLFIFILRKFFLDHFWSYVNVYTTWEVILWSRTVTIPGERDGHTVSNFHL